MIKKLLVAVVVVPLCLFLFLFWLGFFSTCLLYTSDAADDDYTV